MPFYEYHCTACRSHHEVLQKISDPPLKKCPQCQKAALTKLISAPVFRLKGSGWYETDFKSDQETKRNLVESESASGASASGGATDASKPAAKPEKKAAKTGSAAAPRKSAAKAAKPASGKKTATKKPAKR